MVSRTAARAASESAFDIPVFSAILATNSGLRKVSTTSFFLTTFFTASVSVFAATVFFVAAFFVAFYFLTAFFFFFGASSSEAVAFMAVDLARDEIKALRGDGAEVKASATLAINATIQITVVNFIFNV